MSTTIALGILFVVLALVAVLLQAWLWGPKYWDAAAKKSLAPRGWVRLHRAVGWAYALLYVGFLLEMVPRLWEYQVELPARTVVHATAAIVIGAILLVKIAILRFFRHFEEAMPTLGVTLFVATLVLAAFSIPPALRAHGSAATFTMENRERVARILGRLELGTEWSAEELSSVGALSRGREVVIHRCATCHDLRTVIAEPRTGSGWLSVTRRMQDKPTLGAPLTDDEVLLATAYLVAITPVLRDDVRRREDEAADREGAARALLDPEAVEAAGEETAVGTPPATDAGVESLDGGVPDAGVIVDAGRRPLRPRRRDAGGRDGGVAEPAAESGPSVEPVASSLAPEPPRYSARELLDRRCTDCHGLEDVEGYGGADSDGWGAVVQRMIRRGAELDAAEARILVRYLATTYPAPPL